MSKIKDSLIEMHQTGLLSDISIMFFTIAMTILSVILLASVLGDNNELARCKSLGGNYGKNKCYVKGEEK
jgi:hypothetical protein|nr:MAG TPA: hypothetical protein [Caudoviricetes sp.]